MHPCESHPSGSTSAVFISFLFTIKPHLNRPIFPSAQASKGKRRPRPKLLPEEERSARAMRSFFKDTVLVVNYRHSDTIDTTLDLVQTVYGPLFKQVRKEWLVVAGGGWW